MGNGNGGMGKFILIVLIIGGIIFAVTTMGVENASNKASNGLQSVLEKVQGGLDKANEQHSDVGVENDKDRPYKSTNSDTLERLEKRIVSEDELISVKTYDIEEFKYNGDLFVPLTTDYDIGWDDFENKNCTTYRAVLVDYGIDVKIDENCKILSGEWKDQYGVITKEEDKKSISKTGEIPATTSENDVVKENSGNKEDVDKENSDSKEDKEKEENDIFFKESRNSKDFIVDHVVPLEYAWQSGSSNLTSMEKTNFANDKANMMLTTKKINKDKGTESIVGWLPPEGSIGRCDYLDRYGHIKAKYNLNVTEKEFNLLKKEYGKCNK